MKHTTALFCTTVLLAAWFGLSSCAQNAFYYPDHTDYGTPAQQGLRYEDVRFASKDGTPLHGWFVPAQCPAESSLHPAACPARATVIHFHGNAQNLSAHWAAVRHLPAEGYNVFLFDYRGYGQSGGTPSQQGLFDDGNAALDYVRTRSDVDKEKLLVFGQSLGGTNAIAVVGAGNKAGVRAVAIESTFASYSKIGNDKIPSPVHCCCAILTPPSAMSPKSRPFPSCSCTARPTKSLPRNIRKSCTRWPANQNGWCCWKAAHTWVWTATPNMCGRWPISSAGIRNSADTVDA